MKKILCLALALLIIVLACAACKKDEPEASETPADSIPDQVESSTPAESVESTPAESENKTPAADKESCLVECDETVYVIKSDLRLRTAMDFDDDSNIKVVVPVGTELKRVAKGEVGDEMWSKVVYEGVEYYTSSKFLSTNIEDTIETEPVITMEFETCDETVYVLAPANLRITPDKTDNSNVAIDLPKGTELKRTGIAYDTENDPEGLGWSRVEYQGKTYYIRNSLVATELPAESTAA